MIDSGGSGEAGDGDGLFRIPLGVVTVFAFLLFFFLFDIAFFHGFEFEWVGGHDLKIDATLGARNDFALVDIVFFKIEFGIAFRAKHHKASLADYSPLIIFIFPALQVKGCWWRERDFPNRR
jgi:hypothetical protein